MNVDGHGSAKKFCLRTAAAAFFLLGIVAIFNAVIDPFRLYGLFEIQGLNAYKPEIYNRVRLLKAFEVRRMKPRGLVLGTSRAHLAIRPSHEGWDPGATPRYNLAFDAATTKEMYHYLLHAQATRPLKQVVLGLELYQLNDEPSGQGPDFDRGLLRRPSSLLSMPLFITADLRVLTSMDTLEASIATIQARDVVLPKWFAPDGQRRGDIFFRKVDGMFLEYGAGPYFDMYRRNEAESILVGILSAGAETKDSAPPTEAPTEAPPGKSNLEYVRKIVEFCRGEGIDLRIYMSPVHAHVMEIQAALGEWLWTENSKRDLVRLLAEDAARHSGERPIPLYDFVQYSSVTTETPPEPESREEMKYYWDPSHAKEIVGDFILDRLFGFSHPERHVPEDFGVQLTEENIEVVIARMRADQKAYQESHRDDIDQIRALVEEVREEKMRELEESRAAHF